MSKDKILFTEKESIADWLTIHEAVKITKVLKARKLTDSDIYRHALNGDAHLSIYFQSPIVLRKIRRKNNKVKLKSIDSSILNLLFQLDKNYFLAGGNLITSTEGEYFTPHQRIIDTTLLGHEYIYIQKLLAHTLGIPSPKPGAKNINHGISLNIAEEDYQLFNKQEYAERLTYQLAKLPKQIALDIKRFISNQGIKWHHGQQYFPAHDLPQDACFVIRYSELEKIIRLYDRIKPLSSISTRMSTPLSRLFWLACKHNEAISPLIRQPYKLLSIFEQWASADGITDRLSGDTLKNALDRGSPSSTSLSD